MRITGGLYGGRLLESPQDRTIRPTTDKVRQAIFNILNARGVVDGAVVLDAFCGTGALGIEALSWGGLCCTFIEKNRRSLDLCRKNYVALKIGAKSSFVLKDATKLGIKPMSESAANLVFLDPPYKQDLVQQSLVALQSGGWIAPNAVILTETEKTWNPATLASLGYELILTRDYGDTRVALLAAPSVSR
ncbi:MAG: 16S rRNA (guanine(966)-N(2))-methyltransferase RsmD [Micavibrio aeruginosavorus]|uniref:16S rRNA (Guanine(966)-N(2))-methyltransferase RsmD n=1 Tax=Micavibrio aeruginosavorus TaxID=349221 RepID=A0A2W5N3Z2_9BACT|nr:MAG: 16S rRNA (guanine(966)-N(2))-methyltransferase RsmD [Micavibrio aeruginosavorus]